MMDRTWRSVSEITLEPGPDGSPVLLDHLARAVVELALPELVLIRLREALAAALGRAWPTDTAHTAPMTLVVSVLQMPSGRATQSWGFFLVEKHLEHNAGRRIDIMLYPEQVEGWMSDF